MAVVCVSLADMRERVTAEGAAQYPGVSIFFYDTAVEFLHVSLPHPQDFLHIRDPINYLALYSLHLQFRI